MLILIIDRILVFHKLKRTGERNGWGRKSSISIFKLLRSVNKSHIFFPVQVNSLKIELKNEIFCMCINCFRFRKNLVNMIF